MDTQQEELRVQLNAETGRIAWMSLVPFFARGQVVRVDPALDLVEVAAALSRDEAERVREWMDAGSVGPVSDEAARRWQEEQREVWAVVVAPWVVVQEQQ